MSRPSVLVNTYVTSHGKTFLDIVSKIFILIGLTLGINRFRCFTNLSLVYKTFSFVYSFICTCLYSVLWYKVINDPLSALAFGIHYAEVMLIIILNIVSNKNLLRFYDELNEFDKEVGCRPKSGKVSIYNLICTVFMLIYILCTLCVPGLPHAIKSSQDLRTIIAPFVLCHILEVYYCGHLLSLLISRLRLINYYMELSLSKCQIMKTSSLTNFGYLKTSCNKSLCAMEKIMNLYHIMIKVYNHLVEAIKWQIFTSLVTAFLGILIGGYKVTLAIIYSDGSLKPLVGFTLISLALLLPWFSPCTIGDQVHYEVIRLRELLAFRIYENKMDKSSRTQARALLAWTETRNFSFSLLCMFDIDVSLPFKFIGLLVTYLIILLQFQKVMSPS